MSKKISLPKDTTAVLSDRIDKLEEEVQMLCLDVGKVLRMYNALKEILKHVKITEF